MAIIGEENKIVLGYFRGKLCAGCAKWYIHQALGLKFKTFKGVFDKSGIWYPEFKQVDETIISDN